MFLFDLSEGLAIKQVFGKTLRSRHCLFLKQEGSVLGSLAVYAENEEGWRGDDTCSSLGLLSLPWLRSRAMCHPEESELRDVKPGWRHCSPIGPVVGTDSEIGPCTRLFQQTGLAASADRAGCAWGRIAGLVMKVSSLFPHPTPLQSLPLVLSFLHRSCPFALTLPLDSDVTGGMLSPRLVQYGMAEKRLHLPSSLETLTFLLWPPGCLDTALSCHGIIAIKS